MLLPWYCAQAFLTPDGDEPESDKGYGHENRRSNEQKYE